MFWWKCFSFLRFSKKRTCVSLEQKHFCQRLKLHLKIIDVFPSILFAGAVKKSRCFERALNFFRSFWGKTLMRSPQKKIIFLKKFTPVFRSKWSLPLFSIWCSSKVKHIIFKAYSASFVQTHMRFSPKKKHFRQRLQTVFKRNWSVSFLSVCWSWNVKHVVLKMHLASLDAFMKNAHALPSIISLNWLELVKTGLMCLESFWANLNWLEPIGTGRKWTELVWADLNRSEPVGTDGTGLNGSEPVWIGLNRSEPVWTVLGWFEPFWAGLNYSEPAWIGLSSFELVEIGLSQYEPVRSGLIQVEQVRGRLNQSEPVLPGRKQSETMWIGLQQSELFWAC